MKYGITGNTSKEKLWLPVSELIQFMSRRGIPFCMPESVSHGLIERGLGDPVFCSRHQVSDLSAEADLVLSFGGDGTLLKSAYDVGRRETPILGINIGRLGFLADIEVARLEETIEQLEAGHYRIEPRLVLQADLESLQSSETRYALNEFVIDKTGSASMVKIEVLVDEAYLNTYWTDGLIFATPTGSTAYSLSAGGPIILPGSEVIVVTPIAPHTLTVRPIILPDAVKIDVRVATRGQPYVMAADGRSQVINRDDVSISIRRAEFSVNLVKLPGQDYFKTLRTKLAWGQGGLNDERETNLHGRQN